MVRKFSYYASRFIKWARHCKHATTVNVYRHYFKRFLAEVGDLSVRRITPAVLSKWAKTWHASQAIVRLFRWCVHEDRSLRVNPLAFVKHPPKGERKRTGTREEIAALLRRSPADFRRLLIGYRETWARPGELRRATWADVYPQTTRPKLREALRTGQAFVVLWDYKNRKQRREPNEPRVILLSPRVGRLLCRLMKRWQDSSEPIFQNDDGEPWTANAVRCRMRRLRSALGWKRDERGENFVPYSFRHKGATAAAAFGLRDALLGGVLGQRDPKTTRRYTHLRTEHLRKALLPFWANRDRS